jgi:chromosome segregation ATPase
VKLPPSLIPAPPFDIAPSGSIKVPNVAVLASQASLSSALPSSSLSSSNEHQNEIASVLLSYSEIFHVIEMKDYYIKYFQFQKACDEDNDELGDRLHSELTSIISNYKPVFKSINECQNALKSCLDELIRIIDKYRQFAKEDLQLYEKVKEVRSKKNQVEQMLNELV